MKKTFVCLTMAGALVLSSCIGSFGLTNKLLGWNRTLSDKFINELVFIVIQPAYAVTGVVDLVVLNSIEFWSGKSALAKVGHVEKVWGKDGKMYAVKTLKDGYEITKPTGDKINFVYNDANKSWNMKEANGEMKEIFRFNPDGTTIKASLQNGEKMDVSMNQQGMYELRMAANNGTYFAAR
jgi:hypothetical protein